MDRYGTRNVAAVGTLMATTSYVASAFATSVLYLYITSGVCTGEMLVILLLIIWVRGTPLEYWEGGGAGVFLEINIFVGNMGEINKWPQDMVGINIVPTQEVKINTI